MKFKHWKEAEQRASEITTTLEGLNTQISTAETEARNEETTIERREVLLKEISSNVEKRDALNMELGEANTAKERLKSEEERQLGLLKNVSTSKVEERAAQTNENVYETRAYELAWAEYIRSGGKNTEVRDLINTQTEGSAGIMVPKTLINRIEDRLKNAGKIVALCSQTSIKGITTYPLAKSYTDSEWHDELDTADKKEKSIELASVTLEAQFIAEQLRTTRKFEEDSIEAFWNWLWAELPDALLRKMDYSVLHGTEGIKGILTNTDTNFVKTLANHPLNFNSVNVALAELADGTEDTATVVMNRKTFFNNVMGMTGTDGHPIFTQAADNTGRMRFYVNALPVTFTNNLPAYDEAAANKPYMVVGDFSAMMLNFPSGTAPRLIRDEITKKHNNIIEYLSEVYVGGNIIRYDSFVKVSK